MAISIGWGLTDQTGLTVFLSRKVKFDGIFCGTDFLANYICVLLRRKGLRIPEDVHIIGFDGLKNVGDNSYLVSTFVQPVEEIAKICVDIILNDNRDSLPPLMCLPVTYAYGRTTKTKHRKHTAFLYLMSIQNLSLCF